MKLFITLQPSRARRMEPFQRMGRNPIDGGGDR